LAQVTPEMLSEVRAHVLDALDANKDGRIELGEFAKYDSTTVCLFHNNV